MRLKISFSKEVDHKDTVCCVCWNTPEEIISCGQVLVKQRLIDKFTP